VGRIGLHLVDPLVWQTQPGQFAPGLATSWTASPDATSYTFKLRSDVRFHDGTPLTAEAVKVTFDRIVDPETKSQTAFSFIGPYDRTEVVDPYTVRVRFKTPYAAFLDGASTPYLGIISPPARRPELHAAGDPAGRQRLVGDDEPAAPADQRGGGPPRDHARHRWGRPGQDGLGRSLQAGLQPVDAQHVWI